MDDWFEKEQLHFAAQDGDVRKVRALIELGSPTNEFDEPGRAPHYVAEYGRTEVNAVDQGMAGNTPLW